jgi:6-phospho-3-hexuloisomerase
MDFKQLAEKVVLENKKALLDMDTGEIGKLLDAISDAHVVYDTTCLNIGKGDLLIVNCGCTAVGLVVIRLAKKAGSTVCVVTAHPESEAGQLADLRVRLRAQVNPGNPQELPSIQPMAALFEQAVFLFENILIMMLMERLKITPGQMERRHTNVDGYMSID